MTLTKETQAEIIRLSKNDHFTANAIASALNIHHDTVNRVLSGVKSMKSKRIRQKITDPYTEFIENALEKYPSLRATRIYSMLKDRGFKGSIETLRICLRSLRPKFKKAYMPLNFIPGEQGQVDWASFGKITIGRAKRNLSCFIMVLSYSRAIYARFTLDQRMENFLSEHIRSFKFFGGVPRALLYDNLKSVVLERIGDSIKFNSVHHEFSGFYRFKPLACNPRSGWEKGRVERSIRYIRDSFFAGREFKDINDLNSQLLIWLNESANLRGWPDDRSMNVIQKLEEEKVLLLPLPVNDFHVELSIPVCSGKFPFIRFDLNDYSIPYIYVGKTLTLWASENLIKIYDKQEQIAFHHRTYDKGVKVKSEAHFEGLLQERGKAKRQSFQDKICQDIPEAKEFFIKLMEFSPDIGRETRVLANLRHEFGLENFRIAILEALKRKLFRSSCLSQILQSKSNEIISATYSKVEIPNKIKNLNLNPVSTDTTKYDTLINKK